MTMSRLELLMEKVDADAALITSDVNRLYYTGFASSAGTILAVKGESWLIIDSRYFEAASRGVTACSVILQDQLHEQLAGLLHAAGVKTLAVESRGMTLASFDAWRTKLTDVELVGDNSLSDAIGAQRARKSADEIARIRQAQQISDRTFAHILDFIRPGLTEREIALEMEFYSRRIGSDGAAFSFIVCAGKNSSLPHGVPGDQVIGPGDFIVMDFGSVVGGYCSDMTRTVAVGAVSDRQRIVYNTVLGAQQKALKSIRAGRVCSDIDKIARDVIDASPFAGSFGHGLGHALGLEVHEGPSFNQVNETPLEPGMVMSVEPGIYLPGEFGVRIEDIVAVTRGGCDNLTASSKELFIL